MRPGADFERAELGDERRTQRAVQIAAAFSAKPERSIPEALGHGSALDLAYRFLANDTVDWSALASAHAESTWQRVGDVPVVAVIHDTSDVAFAVRNGRLRENLAKVTSKTQGFFFHTSLLVADVATSPQALGVVGLRPYVHQHQVSEDAGTFWKLEGGILENEADRWWDAIQKSEKAAPAGVDIIHIADREADDYRLFSRVTEAGHRFVFRCYRERAVSEPDDSESTLWRAIEAAPWAEATREVALSARSSDRNNKDMKTNPPRGCRSATLSFRCASVRLLKPRRNEHSDLPDSVALNVIEVLERCPPSGEAPVRWLLATTERVTNEADILKIVDLYRTRWVIEEFFKCLKSGCLVEAAQLDSASALLRLLAVFLPVATYLLHMRYMHRHHPNAAARAVLGEDEIAVLQAEHPTCFKAVEPTVAEVLEAIARLGGHLKRNGPPGWLTLARGSNALFLVTQGWRARERFERLRSIQS